MDAEVLEGEIILSSSTSDPYSKCELSHSKEPLIVSVHNLTIPSHIQTTPAPCMNVMLYSVYTRYSNTVKSSCSNGWFSGNLFTRSSSSLLELESWISRSVRSQGYAALATKLSFQLEACWLNYIWPQSEETNLIGWNRVKGDLF